MDNRDMQINVFVIDRAGTIHWSCVVPRNMNPGADGILARLESIIP